MRKTRVSCLWRSLFPILLMQAIPFTNGCGESVSPRTVFENNASSPNNPVPSSNLGEIRRLDFSAGNNVVIQVPKESNVSDFALLLSSGNPTQETFSLKLQGSNNTGLAGLSDYDLVPIQDPASSHPLIDDPLHEWAHESEIYFSDPYFQESNDSKNLSQLALSSNYQKGDIRDFQVINSISSGNTTSPVKARLRYSGTMVNLYVDLEVENNNPEDLNDADIIELADSYEKNSLPLLRRIFGREPDVNQDGHITILVTPVLNRFCISGGLVTGFFFPGDLFPNQNLNPTSNHEEILYLLVPDSKGRYCSPLLPGFVMKDILPGVLAHETQHLISFNHHVLVHKGPPEELWLNEGMSLLAEDLSGYGQENYSRMKIFLDQANETSLMSGGKTSLATRGMAYMLLRYLYEQSSKEGDPVSFINRLTDTDKSGAKNFETAFRGTDPNFDEFAEFIENWQLTLMISGTGFSDSSRFNYQPITRHPITNNEMGICLRCFSGDHRNTSLDGPAMITVSSSPTTVSIDSGSVRFFRITSSDQQLAITAPQNARLQGALLQMNSTPKPP